VLLARLTVAYWTLSAAKRLVSLPVLARLAWREPRPGTRDARRERVLIGLALRAARLAGRLDRDCLPRSLLLYRGLSSIGANPQLVVGVRSADGQVSGHAWVVVDGRVAAESEEALAAFTPVCAFGPGGRVIFTRESGC
jgi:hypothetical protein